MACCDGSIVVTPRETREVVVDLTLGDSFEPGFKGKNPTFIGMRFENANKGALKAGGYYAKFNAHIGDRFSLSVFRERLPFDELVMTLGIDVRTGTFQTMCYMPTPAPYLVMEFEFDQKVEIKYTELGDGIYRISNASSALALLPQLDIRPSIMHELREKMIDPMLAYPIMLHHVNDDLCTIASPIHNNWLNDTLWQ